MRLKTFYFNEIYSCFFLHLDLFTWFSLFTCACMCAFFLSELKSELIGESERSMCERTKSERTSAKRKQYINSDATLYDSFAIYNYYYYDDCCLWRESKVTGRAMRRENKNHWLATFCFEMYNPNCILNDQSNQIDNEIEHQKWEQPNQITTTKNSRE